jgi:uncharacterized membrane protein
MTRSARLVLGAQAIYYVVTGVWPLVNMRSFEIITGPKADDWLVYTVGLLLTVIGASILAAICVRQTGAPIRVLAFGTAIAIGAIEIVYVTAREISAVYLFDAAVEVALAFALAWTLLRARSVTRAK